MNNNKGYMAQFLNYFFRYGKQTENMSFSIKAMHWINRIAIIMFLVGITISIIKRL